MAQMEAVRDRYTRLAPFMDERQRRLFVANESVSLGRGGASLVSRATGVSRLTIMAGIAELETGGDADNPAPKSRVRRPGGGRKKTVTTDETLKTDLERLVDPVTRGHPESALRWTCKSVRKLSAELKAQGHHTSHRMVAELLHEMGYSLQANRKTKEGSRHPDRNEQFQHIHARVTEMMNEKQPVISVDTKKKELVGNFKNGGKDLRPQGDPEPVKAHDFVDPKLGRASPYGIYDVANNTGWVNVGISRDTASFAVESIRRWWNGMGKTNYPAARKLLITADCGGSNGPRLRLWKVELQKLANETGLEIEVCHLPPGTSKWNKIEHRLFAHISMDWRGRPLTSFEVIVNLIAATTTAKGLKVHAGIDSNQYATGVEVTDEQFDAVNLTPDSFHGEWNYTVKPHKN
jgi:transposase